MSANSLGHSDDHVQVISLIPFAIPPTPVDSDHNLFRYSFSVIFSKLTGLRSTWLLGSLSPDHSYMTVTTMHFTIDVLAFSAASLVYLSNATEPFESGSGDKERKKKSLGIMVGGLDIACVSLVLHHVDLNQTILPYGVLASLSTPSGPTKNPTSKIPGPFVSIWAPSASFVGPLKIRRGF